MGILGSIELVDASEEGRLTHDHLLDIFALDALGIAESLQWNVRIVLLELLEGHLIVVGLRIAQLGAALRDEGDAGLVLEDALSILLSLSL